MRTGWSLIGLVLALVLVAVLLKKQLSRTVTPVHGGAAIPGVAAVPVGAAAEQSRAVQDQVKQQVQAQMQGRPIADADQ
nr:hypothetical protein [uncultured Rhodoferax sp.]